MKHLLWLSQHQPLSRQVAALRQLFGEDVHVHRDVNPFANAEEILQRYTAGRYDDLMVVAPLSVIQRLCELGLRPLWGEMEQVARREEAEVTVKNRHYRFVRFRRAIAVVVHYQEVAEMLNEQIMNIVPAELAQGVREAIDFARERHGNQSRFGGELHIDHVLRVGREAVKYVKSHQLKNPLAFVQASFLHDVVEDTQTTFAEIEQRFGTDVARIVAGLSHEDEEETDEVYLARVAAAGEDVIKVKRFDRLDNIRSLIHASASFRAQKIAEVRAALSIWRQLDLEGADQIQTALGEVERL